MNELRRRARNDALHIGVKPKAHPELLRGVAQQVSELPAVSDLVVGQMNAGVQGHVGVEPGLDHGATLRVDDSEFDAQFFEHLDAGLDQRQLLRRAQQHQKAVGSLVVELQAARDLVQALAAVQREALHARSIGLIDRRATGSPPSPHPRERRRVESRADAHRRVAAEQLAQHFGRHAGCGPWRDVARRDHAGIGEAGFGCDAAAPLEHGDREAALGELLRGRQPRHAAADHGDTLRSRPQHR